MIQRRLLSIFFVILFAFAQQQALVHPYVHLANTQESAPQQNSSNDKHGQTHSELCEKCISLAGMGAAAHSHPPVVHIPPAAPVLAAEPLQYFSSTSFLPYSARAPPHLA